MKIGPKTKERCKTDPVFFAHRFLGEDLWEKQKEIVESVRDNTRTAVRTCHGIGKTRVASDVALWFLLTHKNSVVITTAPTWRQVEQLLWREIRERWKASRLKFPGRIFQKPQLEISDKWFALGVSTKEPERFQGFHAEWILIIVDESSGVDDAIFEAMRGIMSAGNVRLLLLGNPTKPQGEFYDAFNSKRHMYSTIVVSAWSTPNLEPLKADYEKLKTKPERLAYLRSAPSPRSYLVSPSWVADMLDEFGEDSPIYQVRVLGEFPPDAPDQLIPLHWIEAAQNRWEELGEKWWEDDSSQGVIMGADIARYGDAETVICSRLGDIVAPLAVLPKQDTMQTAGAIVQKSQSTGTLSVNIDVVGVGAGVYDRCKELKVPAQAVNVGEKAKDSEKFLNLRAEAYWSLRQLFEQRKIAIPPDQKLAGQLSSLKYKVTSSGKIQVESKEDMRKRNVASPDRADALCLAFCPSTKLLVSRCITAGKYTNTIDFRRR